MKIIILFGSNPTRNRKFIKNCKKKKKIKKLEKNGYGFFSSKNWLEMAEKETKIQIIVSFHSYPMRNRKFQTSSKKIQKIIKYYYGFISCQNKGENAEKWRK